MSKDSVMLPAKVGLPVCAERCNECLFSPERIVSGQRMRQVLRECEAEDTHFVCHKHTLRQLDGETEATNAVCRGFYDRDPYASNLMRIAARLNCVYFVDESGKEVEQ